MNWGGFGAPNRVIGIAGGGMQIESMFGDWLRKTSIAEKAG